MNPVPRILTGTLPALALFATIWAGEPARAADAPMTWLGVTLGAPVSSLREIKGDPMVVTGSPDVLVASGATPPGMAPQRKARYWLGASMSLIVTERRGRVVGLDAYAPEVPDSPVTSVAPDPLGARLGQKLEEITTQIMLFRRKLRDAHVEVGRGVDVVVERVPELAFTLGDHNLEFAGLPEVTVRYEFEAGRVNSIQWNLTPSAIDALAGEDLPPISEASGEGFATAILDAQPDETTGVRWEYIYLAFHTCDKDTSWKPKGQALASNGGRRYDILHVVCPTTKAERDFFFDITPYFGK